MRGARLALVALAACAAARAVAQAAPLPADLDRFYSAPSLIGTAPRPPVWSPRGDRLAFLWNTDGTNFLDVYVTDTTGAAPVRVTRFPRPSVPAGESTAWATQRAALAAELDGGVTATAWHPDGTRLLVTFRGDLWLAATGREPIRLTATHAAESRAAFAPGARGDSAVLAFVREGDLWVATLRGDSLGAARRLTALAKDGVGVERVEWAPSGAQLAIVEVDRTGIRTRGIPDYLGEETVMPMIRRAMPGEDSEHRRVGLVTLADGAVQWLPIEGAPTDVLHGFAWSPDGTRLAIDWSDVFVKDRRLLVAEASTQAVRVLVREQEPGNVSAEWQVAWAPDGRGVYFTSDRVSDYHVWYAPLDGRAPRAITQGTFAVFSFTVTPRGIVAVVNAGRPEERQVALVPLAGGALTVRTTRAGTHTPTVSPDGRRLADLFSSDSVPPDLWLVDLAGREARTQRVTTSPRPEFARYRFTAPRYVTFPSRADGATLHARVLLPPGYVAGRRYPVIVGSSYSNTARNQWGGRNAHPLWGLDQVLLERGYVLIGIDV
nr:DPP IV N-terminal domain-containing protein [Gemmatimonadaceae bacterium]